MVVICPNNKKYDIDDNIYDLSKNIRTTSIEHFNCSSYELILKLNQIETPVREIWFRDMSTINNILDGFATNNTIPAIEVTTRDLAGTHPYKVKDGFHRYWLSHLVGFKNIPVTINNFLLSDLDEENF